VNEEAEMFWGRDDDNSFSEAELRRLVWSGDQEGIKRWYSQHGVMAMMNSDFPQYERQRLRETLRSALLEPNRSVRRGVFTDRLLVRRSKK
jgi:hypothetical protein